MFNYLYLTQIWFFFIMIRNWADVVKNAADIVVESLIEVEEEEEET